MNIYFKQSNSISNLKSYCELYKNCFNEKKLKLNYLNWLYNENPIGNFVGIDCFHDGSFNSNCKY